MYGMKKILIAIGILCSVCTMYAQEEKMVEQGLLIGAGAGFPVQNGAETDGFNSGSYWNYRHDYKLNSLIGYRLRFLPERTFFYDLDLTLGFQKMETDKYWSALHVPAPDKDKTLTEFVMPISVAASWNWRFARRFFLGAGLAPTLYAQPHAAFDLGLLAKVGYRVSRHCELALSYQYGCLNTLKHFNDGPANGRRGHLTDLTLSVFVPF